MRRGAAALALALLAALFAAASAPAGYGPQLTSLRVTGGEAGWHAVNDFRVDWDRTPEQRLAWPLSASSYSVREPNGRLVVGPIHVPGANDVIDHIHVPNRPGTYRLEVWLQSGTVAGPHYDATLRFDDSAPEPPDARPRREWFAAGQRVELEMESTLWPRPVSGIGGYAVSSDRGRGSRPCAKQICAAAETQPGSGQAGDTVSLGLLPEGASFVRLAAVSGAGVPSPAVTVPVRVDASVPEVSLTAPPGWSAGPVTVTATASDPLSGMLAAGPSGPFTAIAIDGGVPSVASGERVAAAVRGEGVHRVAYYARDAAGNVADGQAAAPAPRHAAVRIDETPPEVLFSRAQDPARPERIEATVADALSGPHPTHGSIAVRAAGSRQAYQPLPTGVAGDRLLATWSSDEFPPGRYEFRATGYDAAGNASRSERRAKGGRMILHNPLKETTEVRLGFGGRRMVWRDCARRGKRRRCRRRTVAAIERRPASSSVGYGRRPLISGQLLGTAGRPLAGRAVEIAESFAAGAAPPRRTSLTRTDGSGTFRLRLAAGPSRSVEARFPGSPTLSRAASRALRLGVRSAVRLRASARNARIGGRPLLFSGRVLGDGAAAPLAGRPVELQFRIGRSAWSEFRTVETDARGRFRYRYAFADDDSHAVRFQFRAVVGADRSWPYEPAASRPLLVTGR